MAANETTRLTFPIELCVTAGSSSGVYLLGGPGAPDGNTSPWSDAGISSMHFRTDATDDESSWYMKVDMDSANDDWVQAFVDMSEGAFSLENDLTMSADESIYFRDTDNFIHSNAASQITIAAASCIYIGDGTNQARFAQDGELTLEGTAQVTRAVQIGLDSQHGTATSEAFNGAPSINLDADGETWYFSFEAPKDWNAASDMTIVCMVGNEIAETDGDDVSFTGQVRGYADGETTGDAGQAVTFALNLTGGDEAINIVNRVTGVIDWNEGTYPIAAGDMVVVELAVNLGTGTECTGPLHIISQWVEYTANSLGTAT